MDKPTSAENAGFDAGDGLKASVPLGNSQTESTKKKRIRPQFSCKQCREKKLKCNRGIPCDQCEKRGQEYSCEYLGGVHKGTPSALRQYTTSRVHQIVSENVKLQNKVRQLEKLLADAGVVGPGHESENSHDTPPVQNVPVHDSTSGKVWDVQQPGPENFAISSHLLGRNQRHVFEENWEAILNDVTELTSQLEPYDEEIDDADADIASLHTGPLLLLGGFPESTKEELLDYLPHRTSADRMIAKFFQIEEPAWMIFHVPTFLKQYDELWNVPEDVSISWLGLLYIMFAWAAWYCLESDETDAFGDLGSAQSVYDTFQFAYTRCLSTDNYTLPGKFKIEGLALYYGLEYYRRSRKEAAISTSFLWAGTLRLAMHMGYHRDPRHFKEISPFEGEMRRRLWAQLIEIDVITSFEFGLPSLIHHRFTDTAAPRNLNDDDLSEEMTSLPPSRPETERTRVLYTISEGRIMSVFAKIMSAVTDGIGAPYSTVMELDAMLAEVDAATPPMLRPRSFSQAITDPIGLLIQRTWLHSLVQRARCVLHRRWLRAGQTDKRYARSRWACVDAAVRLLQKQHEMYVETQPGGRLVKDRWTLLRTIPDYLLANMILCLELSYLKGRGPSEVAVPETASAEHNEAAMIPTQRIIDVLQSSRQIWQTAHIETPSANKAFKIISQMLSMSTGNTQTSSPSSNESEQLNSAAVMPSPHSETTQLDMAAKHVPSSFDQVTNNVNTNVGEINPAMSWQHSFPVPHPEVSTVPLWSSNITADSSEPPTLMGDMDSILGWSYFDSHMQNMGVDDMHIPWDFLFEAS